MLSELAPGFLVAAPSLLDPNFKEAVVLLIDHRPEGSLGFIVNRVSEVQFKDVAIDLGIAEEGQPPPELPVMVGGPVARQTGWIVFDPTTSELSLESTIEVSDQLRVSASRELLAQLAKSQSGERHMLVLGYAGWGAGQLDEELKQGAWIPVDLEESVVFDTPVEDRWNAALAALGIDPAYLVFGSVPLQ